MACNCQPGPEPGKGTEVQNIPIKVGEPLSNACERATIIGSIPQVLRYAGFTLVNGATVVNLVSNSGIENMGMFFKTRRGCFQDMNGRLAGSNCV